MPRLSAEEKLKATRGRLKEKLNQLIIVPAYDCSNAEKLRKIIIEANKYNKLCSDTLSKGLYLQAYNHAKEALKQALSLPNNMLVEELGYIILAIKGYDSKNITIEGCKSQGEAFLQKNLPIKNDLLHEIYYNLALSIKHSDSNKALQYLEEANQNKPHDQDILYEQWSLNIEQGNFKESIKIVKGINNPEKEILILISKLASRKISAETAKDVLNKYSKNQLSPEGQKWYLHLMLDIEVGLDNIEAAKTLIDQSISIKIYDLIAYTACILVWYITKSNTKDEAIGDGLSYLEKMYRKYPALSKANPTAEFLFAEFILREFVGQYDKATIMLDKLNAQSKLSNIVTEMQDISNQIRFCIETRNGNFEAAKIHLALTSLDQDIHKGWLKFLEDAQAKEEARGAAPVEEIEDNDLVDAIIEAGLDEQHNDPVVDAQPVGSIILSPKAIHDYYQRKKAAILTKANITKFSTKASKYEASWTLPTGELYDSKQGNVYKLDGEENYYVYIPDDLCGQEDLQAFTTAILKKGIVSRQVGCSGLKFFNNIVEIKTRGDARAWTDTIYVNDEGKYLIIIDEYGNHKAVKTAIKPGKLKIEHVATFHASSALAEAEAYEEKEEEFKFGEEEFGDDFTELVGAALEQGLMVD